MRAPIEPRLLADCPPAGSLPRIGKLPFTAVDEYVTALEDALAMCRSQLDELRAQETRAHALH